MVRIYLCTNLVQIYLCTNLVQIYLCTNLVQIYLCNGLVRVYLCTKTAHQGHKIAILCNQRLVFTSVFTSGFFWIFRALASQP